MTSLFERIWHRLRDDAPAQRPAPRPANLPTQDDPETSPAQSDAAPQWPIGALSGVQLQIEYLDSKRQASTRMITCRRIEQRGGIRYLTAWCLERAALRTFRVDRITAVIDPATGEVHEPGGAWLLRFTDDSTSESPLHYGLDVRRFADFTAGLNVLVFLARCDGQWHDLEYSAIEDFAASWWMRAEIAAPFDGDEIARHATRLGPDSETFFIALQRCATDPVLRQIIARHVAAVIDADGVHHPKELYWGQQVVEVMRD